VCSTRSCRHPEASSNPQAGQLATQRRRPGGGRPAGRDLSAVGYWSGPRAFGSAASSTTTPTPSGCATPMRSAGSPEARTCDVDHLRPVTGGTYGSRCRRLRSPASSREVPAETQEGPAGTGRDGDTAEGSVFGGPETFGGGRREPGGVRSGRWRCPVRGAVARDQSASLTRPAPSRVDGCRSRLWEGG
jgi:hypothetical protein